MRPWLCLLVSALMGTGCAQQVARKVPLDERLNECDEHVKGFRYYLSRPYVVVSKRIPIRTDLELAVLCWAEKSGTLMPALQPARKIEGPAPEALPHELIPPQGAVESGNLYDLHGNKIVGARFIRNYAKGEPPPSILQTTSQFSERPPAELLLGQAAFMAMAADTTPADPAEPPPFQVAFLPDFEEQMAVDNKNHLAYGKFELHFRDGWQLSSTKGTWDSTEVAVRMLQSVSNAISAAAAVQKTALDKLPAPAAPGTADAMEKVANAGATVVIVRRKSYIEPGLYRLQKSWEMQGDEPQDQLGDGLLSSLGLPVVSEVELTLAR